MKSLSRTIPFTPACLAISALITVLGILSSPAAQAETHTKRVEVQNVTGTATYQVPGGPVTEIKPGDAVPAGAVISTSPGSSVDLFLGRNTGVLRLGEDSALKISILQETGTGSDVVTDTHLELQKGECFGHVNKQSGGSTYQITLPDGVVDLKQSRFQISNRALENLTEKAGAGDLKGLTQSTIRFISGQGQFVKDGNVFQFKGAGEYNPGSQSIAPLAAEAAQMLAKEFKGMDTKNDAGSEGNPSTQSTQFAKVSEVSVQPQQALLSPTTGSSN